MPEIHVAVMEEGAPLMQGPRARFDRYVALLRSRVRGDAEIESPCAFGQELLRAATPLADVFRLHHDAVETVLADEDGMSARTIQERAAQVFAECLAPFEAALELARGFEHRAPSPDRSHAEQVLQHLNDRLEEKNKKIAHALHKETAQLLSAVYLTVAEIASDLPHRGRHRLSELRALLDGVDDQLRRLAHDLRPTMLDDLGLIPACEFLAAGMSRHGHLRVTVRGGTGGRLRPELETAVYRVVQEAFTNASRHAQAETVSLEIEREGQLIRGSIRDDGAGFDPAAQNGTATRGFGVAGMRERLAAVGGTLSIVSSPGSGTSIQFEAPVES